MNFSYLGPTESNSVADKKDDIPQYGKNGTNVASSSTDRSGNI
jgi:hypothetical protein